jgi:hypothetical protein
MEELKRKAYRRSLANASRKNTQSLRHYRLLLSGLLLVPVAIVLGGCYYIFFLLPFPLQPDSHTLYSTDWSRDFNAWQGAGWQKRLNGGVHSDHGGLFLSPYVADGTAIQIDVQMKHLGVDAFQYGTISFGIVLKNGNADYKFALGDIDPFVPWYPDTYNSLLNFAIVSVKIQKGTVTLLINGKQVAQKSINFPLRGSSPGLFAGGDSIVEARSFRVDKVLSYSPPDF